MYFVMNIVYKHGHLYTDRTWQNDKKNIREIQFVELVRLLPTISINNILCFY